MKIAIEGMDGVGKTTISKLLAQELGYKYVNKPFEFLFDALNLSEDDIKRFEWKLYEIEDEALLSTFYGLGIIYGTRCIECNDVVYDRHFISNYYWHGNEETKGLHEEFIRICGKPDLTVLLKANVETRMKRISSRNSDDKDLSNIAMYEYGYDKMEEFLKNNDFNYIIVDTENNSIEEIIKIIVNNISKNIKGQFVRERKK